MQNFLGWFDLWKRIEAKGDPTVPLWRLMIGYAEPWRRYHTLNHLMHGFSEFEKIRHLLDSPDSVAMALWYHDVVYDPKREDNEEQSVCIFQKVAEYAGLALPFINQVSGFIRATQHKEEPKSSDAKFLLDIDLAILGQSEKRFDEYEQDIREEYRHVSDADFKKGRQEILTRFLDRPGSIYYTDFFRKQYGGQALGNLVRAINR